MEFKSVDLVSVKLSLHDQRVPLGRLALYKGKILFEYDSGFLSRGLNISPFQLPLQQGVFSPKDRTFDGLYGVFNDSLPDGWGKLLLDRAVVSRGVPYQRLGPLDRLAHVGSQGMGALIYEPDYYDRVASEEAIHLDELDTKVQEVLSGDSQEVIDQLLELGGSSAGARPKILVGYNKQEDKLISGRQVFPEGYEPWIIKFASASDQRNIGQIEYAYSLMAKSAGIDMPDTKLFQGAKGKSYFGVKRFDRIEKRRTHMHTASGLLHADHRVPSLDYENLLRCTLALNRDIREVEKVFRLACFNVFSHNRDDHSKNFSFLMNEKGEWSFAPAYDLTFSFGPGGEHSAMVMGEGRAPGRKHLLALAEKFQIKDAPEIIDKVVHTISHWKVYADEAEIDTLSSQTIEKEIRRISDGK